MPDTPQKRTAKEIEKEAAFEKAVTAARRKVVASIKRQRKLIDNLRADLKKHGDPDKWKRFGDLLLANAANVKREGDLILLTDYFDDSAPEIGIEGDKNSPISEIAEDYFRRYAKARNGHAVIHDRIEKTEAAIATAGATLRQIDAAVEANDREFLSSLIEPPKNTPPVGRKKKQEVAFKGARRFISSDGFEILVGKKAADNDYLTFRITRSLDTWMHAADYPGSHVVVRNPNRKQIPDRTLVEAAQLAAFYSSGSKQTKAAVNYTLKKFVNKPRRAAAGLVSLSSFKTILVEPKVGNVTRP